VPRFGAAKGFHLSEEIGVDPDVRPVIFRTSNGYHPSQYHTQGSRDFVEYRVHVGVNHFDLWSTPQAQVNVQKTNVNLGHGNETLRLDEGQ
jgi:hypothetical protein